MVSVVAKSCTTPAQISPAMIVQEKGSRNKRKFRADPPLADPTNIINLPQSECTSYEFTAEKFEIIPGHGHLNGCDMCGSEQDGSEALKLDLGLSCAVGSAELGMSQPKEQTESAEDIHNADWSDLSESQLEELVLSNLDAIFKSAIKKLVAYGYSEEVVAKAVLRSGICYGCKDSVSNIVDNALAFLRRGQEIDSSRENYFDDLQQLQKYILAELVCVLREVRPFYSTGDAMWCLLICDMNVSQACAMDSDYNCLTGDGATSVNSTGSEQVQPQTGTRYSEHTESVPSKPKTSVTCTHNCLCETPNPTSLHCGHTFQASAPNAGLSNLKGNSTFVLNGIIPHKMCSNSSSDKSFTAVGTSRSAGVEEKFVGNRKGSGITKREYILRQKSIHLEKHYRYGSKGVRGKITSFGGLILDKKLKSVAESTGLNVKNASNTSKAVGVNVPQGIISHNTPVSVGFSSTSELGAGTPCLKSTQPKCTVSSSRPAVNPPPSLPIADTELSLSFPANGIPAPLPVSFVENPDNLKYSDMPNDKFQGQRIPLDRKDEMIMKLAPRVHELENHLRDWTEWANQKVMQAARRLGKDKAELKTLKQEKEEVERIKKEKKTLEDNTMKKLSEMESALRKASGQVDRANAAVRRLEIENVSLKREMEGAKLRATESAASCQEASDREKKTLIKFQSWEKQKAVVQEELTAEKHKLVQLEQRVERAKNLKDQIEARWKQELKAKEDLLAQANSFRDEREQIETSAKSKEDAIRSRAENNMQKYKDDIDKLQKEISQIRLDTDSPKIAALKRGMDGSYASKLTEDKTSPAPRGSNLSYISSMAVDFHHYPESGGVKRERECVMCLSEEMSVVFLPCAHQVVCAACNELHAKQGMKDCPSCRSPIQQRICVRYAHS
ncbi:hypothetical protein LIER_22375 [Lithospermum erythrorhizon]|uniref:RING-type domain-containing protein n=1 Tax=Lithospermum erythrorhizon TaxID=34254 RepID=A0AAV3QVZ7_LITER